MISTFAIVVAGVSLIIVVVTMYRNTSISNNPIYIDTEKGANGIVEIQTTGLQNQEVAVVDSEFNLII